MQKKKIVFVGGGTGGHFFPLVAIAESFGTKFPEAELYYAGPTKYDESTLDEARLTFVYVPAGKQRKYRSLLNYLDAIKIVLGFFFALVRLYVIYPDVVVSKGGYTSVPVILASAFLRIPIIIHESDTKMGSANRLALRLAHDVVVAYDELAQHLSHPRVHNFGIPVRTVLLTPPAPDAMKEFDIDPERQLIFVIGGSQGADRINRLILDSLDELLTDFSIIHQTGDSHFDSCVSVANTLITDEAVRKHYHPVARLTQAQMNNAYHFSGIVISRAGSNSINEIAIHGKPSILIPIPEEVSHDQRTNAYAYARTGATVVIEEENLSDNLLRSEIDRIMQDIELYTQMSDAARAFGKTDASSKISDLIAEILQQH